MTFYVNLEHPGWPTDCVTTLQGSASTRLEVERKISEVLRNRELYGLVA